MGTLYDTIEPKLVEFIGRQQMFFVDVDSCQTSCGFGVPLYDHVGQRDLMPQWAANKGPDGIAKYQRDKNRRSLDGFDTDLRQA